MGILDRIVTWVLRDVKLPIHVIQEHMMNMDQDADGCISVAELVAYLKKFHDDLED